METRNNIAANHSIKTLLKRVQLTVILLFSLLILSTPQLMAQCALCTKTAQQLGEGPAAGLNKGIIYLMCIPLSILSIIGYKWYKKEKATREIEDTPQGNISNPS